LPALVAALQTPLVGIDTEFSWRPIDPSQVSAWSGLLSAVQAADDDDEILGEEDLAEEFDDPRLDFARGSLAVFDGDSMVGFTMLQPRSEQAVTGADPLYQMRQWGRVHPKYRGLGIGTRLLEWAEQAAIALHSQRFPGQPLSLVGGNLAKVTDAIELLQAAGYQQARWFHSMCRDLTRPIPDAPVPDEVRIVGYEPGMSADALVVRNESFRDHWGSNELDEETWAHHLRSRALRPHLTFLAYLGDKPVGLILSQEYDAYNEVKGLRDVYIATVGVRRIARNRGVATALLAEVMLAASKDGYVTASLGVDADSPTGALGVYERLGFAVTDTSVSLVKQLIPA
jgi:mycothiol synthase